MDQKKQPIAIRTYRLPASLANDMHNYSRESGIKKDHIAIAALSDYLKSRNVLTKKVV